MPTTRGRSRPVRGFWLQPTAVLKPSLEAVPTMRSSSGRSGNPHGVPESGIAGPPEDNTTEKHAVAATMIEPPDELAPIEIFPAMGQRCSCFAGLARSSRAIRTSKRNVVLSNSLLGFSYP